MYSNPATAKVRGDGVLLSTNLTTPVNIDSSATPFVRPLPTQRTELLWANLTEALRTIEVTDVGTAQSGNGPVEFTWLEYTLVDRIVNSTGISAMEESLSYITALSYSLLAQSWRTKNAQGGLAAANLSQIWTPQNVTLSGTQSLLFTRLKIGGPQLIIAFVSTILLAVVSLASTFGHADQHVDPVIRNGGIVDLFSLLADSALPAILVEGADDTPEGRRVQAEMTRVEYVVTESLAYTRSWKLI